MASNSFQSSFIPKTTSSGTTLSSSSKGILSAIAMGFLILSVVVVAGLYGYKMLLNKDIDSLRVELDNANQSIDHKTLSTIFDFDKKIKVANGILTKHLALSTFYSLLSSSTVSSIQFLGFDYGEKAPDKVSIVMGLKGRAPDYQAVAVQDQIFRKNPNVADLKFKDLNLEQSGFVSFSVEVYIKPATVLYSNLVKAPETVPTQTAATKVPASTTVSTSTQKTTATTTAKTSNGAEVDNINMPDFNNI